MILTSQAEEAHLLGRALDLDASALGEIHDRYFQEIFRYAYLRTGDETLAEDIAGEVFLRLLNSLHGGRPPHTTLRGWLYGVASHLVIDLYHGRPQIPLTEFIADGRSTQGEAEERLRQADVRAAIKQLTAEQQEVLALRFGSAFSVEETAKLTNKSVTAVKALQFRAIDALRQVLVEVDDG